MNKVYNYNLFPYFFWSKIFFSLFYVQKKNTTIIFAILDLWLDFCYIIFNILLYWMNNFGQKGSSNNVIKDKIPKMRLDKRDWR